MQINFNRKNIIGERSPMIYGHFLENFHRQVYGGVYDPDNILSDADGFRTDVLEAMKKIKVPVLRWPGGCFVSSYHWIDGVGKHRVPVFDKAWRVEESNEFGTDEYAKLVKKLGIPGYICTNAGTGTAEEMSDWLEYCNLDYEGKFAKMRIANGYRKPHGIKYWSIGNENYGFWEIGAKTAEEWGNLVREAAKMMRHVDPTIELTAAALSDIDWNVNLLKKAGPYLDWISIHEYWDHLAQTNDLSDYDTVMSFTKDAGQQIREVRGLLDAMHLSNKIKIAFDEWNLRGWHHPNVHTIVQGINKEDYITPRDKNDDNSQYTMADAVFSACFLNSLNRNCDIVGMACFAPVVNTRGCIYTYPEGIVLRSTYYVFDMYANLLGDVVLRSWNDNEEYLTDENPVLDAVVTSFSDKPGYAIAVVNKDRGMEHDFSVTLDKGMYGVMHYISGKSSESYNDIDHTDIAIEEKDLGIITASSSIKLPPHSVAIINLE